MGAREALKSARDSLRIPKGGQGVWMVTQRSVNSQLPNALPRFCSNLTRLSSVVVTCPHCKLTFSRFFGIGKLEIKTSDYPLFKSGQLSLTEVIRKGIREQGCSSSFACLGCHRNIVRSKEPSGVCNLTGKRVTGEKLFCRTVNQCTGLP